MPATIDHAVSQVSDTGYPLRQSELNERLHPWCNSDPFGVIRTVRLEIELEYTELGWRAWQDGDDCGIITDDSLIEMLHGKQGFAPDLETTVLGIGFDLHVYPEDGDGFDVECAALCIFAPGTGGVAVFRCIGQRALRAAIMRQWPVMLERQAAKRR